MSSKLHKVLLHKETSDLVKNNVMVICQIASLLIFIIAYNLYIGNYAGTFPDIPILMITFVIWWLIKKHDLYYPHLVFLFLTPLLAWTSYNTIANWNLLGALWCFPIVVLFYFCLPERLAWVASAVVFVVSLIASHLFLQPTSTFRVCITMLMVIMCCASVFRNLYKQNEQLTQKANKDELTGAYNRTLLQSSLEDAILSKNRVSNAFPCILCVDADHFKRINDTYGHHMGDKALVHLAQTLSQSFDHPKDKLFRMGGEEFLVLKYFRSHDAIATFAERMRASVAELSLFPDGQSMTVSVGVATVKDYFEQTQTDMATLDDANVSTYSSKTQLLKQWNHWIKLADDAMYQAKAAGRNRVVYADSSFS